MNRQAMGFAVIDSAGINVASVSPQERGAMVNWLVVCARVPIHDSTSDLEIEASFRRYGTTHQARVTAVLITEMSKQ